MLRLYHVEYLIFFSHLSSSKLKLITFRARFHIIPLFNDDNASLKGVGKINKAIYFLSDNTSLTWIERIPSPESILLRLVKIKKAGKRCKYENVSNLIMAR